MSPKKPRTPAEILQQYLQFGCYLFLVPFITKHNKLTNTFTCHKSSILLRVKLCNCRKYFCSPEASLFLLFELEIVDLTFQKVASRSVVAIRIITYTLYLIHAITCCIVFWLNTSTFQDILNGLGSILEEFKSLNIHVNTTNLRLAQSCCIAVTLIFSGVESLLCFGQIQNGFYGGFHWQIATAYHILNGHLNCSIFKATAVAGGECAVSWGVWALTVAIVLATAYWVITSAYGNTMFVLHSLLLQSYCQALLLHVAEKRSSSRRQKIIQLCNKLLDVSKTMGIAVGPAFTTFSFGLLPYLAFKVLTLVTASKYNNFDVALPRSCAHVILYMVILNSAAKCNAMMKQFAAIEAGKEEQLGESSEVQHNVREELILLLHRINADEYGIRGIGFTATYSIMGNLAGLLLTYAVIIFQLNTTG